MNPLDVRYQPAGSHPQLGRAHRHPGVHGAVHRHLPRPGPEDRRCGRGAATAPHGRAEAALHKRLSAKRRS